MILQTLRDYTASLPSFVDQFKTNLAYLPVPQLSILPVPQ